MLQLVLALAALASPALTPQSSQGTPATPTATADPEPARIAIIGASVSNGFGLSEELEVNCTLTPFIDAALKLPHGEISNVADGFMFQDPRESGAKQLEQALAKQPTILIAADFPFWFGYGTLSSIEMRMKRLEDGLALMERVDCPLLIGDFPDMSAAINGKSPLAGGGPIIGRHQIPVPEQLEKLNARLHEWAEGRENVHLFQMARFAREIRTAEPLEIRGNSVTAEQKQQLLQTDLLHTKVRGTALLTVMIFDQLVTDGVLEEEDVEWELQAIEAGVHEATKPARDKRRARRERREERKRELEERKRKQEAEQESESLRLEAA